MPSHNWSKVNKTSELGSGKTSTVAFSCCLESGLASFFLSLPSWLLTAFSSPIRCSLDALGLAHSSPFKARAPLGPGLQNSSAYRALGWPMMSWPTLSICMFLDVLTMVNSSWGGSSQKPGDGSPFFSPLSTFTHPSSESPLLPLTISCLKTFK